jgi:hypothetical protein
MYPAFYGEIYEAIEKELNDTVSLSERKEALDIFRKVKNETNLTDLKVKSEAFYYARSFIREAFSTLRKNTLKE